MSPSTASWSAGAEIAARWMLTALVAVPPPGFNVFALIALWLVIVGRERVAGTKMATLMSLLGLGGHIALYVV